MITNKEIKNFALNKLKFDLINFAKAEPLTKEFDMLQEWLKMGFHSDMHWIENNLEKRFDPKNILPSVKSIVVLASNYYNNELHSNSPDTAKISRYAWGRDYHKVLKIRLKKLENFIKNNYPNSETKFFTDTGPIMEKSWAVRSGLGWLGKHTNVISRDIGSWFFISVLLTNIEFCYDNPIDDYCGNCTACIDACPTNAIVQPYLIDSNKCISYLTIEQKPDKEISPDMAQNLDNWVFGCDVCQDVCPWNKFKKQTNEPDFFPRENMQSITIQELLNMSEESFNSRFEGMAVRRTKYKGMKRNLRALDK